MSQEHVDAMRAVFAQFARGDFSAFSQVAEDFEFVTHPEMPDAGTYKGAAADQYRQAWLDSFEEFTMQAVELVDAGDKVLAEVIHRGRPRGGSTEIAQLWWAVISFRDTEVVRMQLFADRKEARLAAGLAG